MAALVDRSRPDGLLVSAHLGSHFHGLFQPSLPVQSEKKEQKVKKKKGKKKNKREQPAEVEDKQAPTVDLHGNPSSFAVYASVRQAVLERQIRDVSHIYNQVAQSRALDSDSEEEEEGKEREEVKVPKIVGLGLCGVFELIRETHDTYPELCVKALQALLDMLQGQRPEGLASEPPDVIDALYRLLLDISVNPLVREEKYNRENSLPSLGCACLLSLVITRGDTGKLLEASMSSLMCPPALADQPVKVPGIVTEAQRSVQAVLLGKAQHPDWLSQGVKKESLLNTIPLDSVAGEGLSASIASDGKYLYLHNELGLHKIGSGYKNTIRGHVYMCNLDFHPKERMWLTFAQGQLFSKSVEDPASCIMSVSRETLHELQPYFLQDGPRTSCVLFSDGEHIGHVSSNRDDSFVVRTYNPRESFMGLVSELQLKLARKCLSVFGSASYDTESQIHAISLGIDEEAASVVAGKEFSLVRTTSGKILYTGKSQCLGIKQGGPVPGKWVDLPITKSPKIVQCSVGHEGQHALLVAEDGAVFFVGTPRRGEDGDTGVAKGRRQLKAVKPKKLIKLEGKTVVTSGCNSGTSALVTKEGELFMLGKDSSHCDHASGHVTDLKDVHVMSVALGKAHAVALTNKGHVYTFGINNKGQCGREYVAGAVREMSAAVTMADPEEPEEDPSFCPPGKHKWKRDQCLVCSCCGECTGYGSSCVNNHGKLNRNPGVVCGCGSGDSGCSECGICKTCAGELLPTEEEMEQMGVGLELLEEMLTEDKERGYLFPLDMIKAQRQKRHGLMQRLNRKGVSSNNKPRARVRSRFKGTDAGSSENEVEHAKVATLPPERVDIGKHKLPATQIACGLHHTVVLLENGEVYTFGGNQYGQLGVGDTVIRGSPVRVQTKSPVVQVAAGSYHTVLLTSSGQVLTFGAFQKGQLGRPGPEEDQAKEKKGHWYALPSAIPGIGAKHGRRATWIGASGDQTFLKIDESLINAHTLARSSVFANKSCIGLIPRGDDSGNPMKCLVINRRDGSCRSFMDDDQASLHDSVVCLDPVFDVLWSYNTVRQEVCCYHVLKSEVKAIQPQAGDVLSAELSMPVKMGSLVTRSHAAMHLLGCLDTLTAAEELGLTVQEEEVEKQITNRVYTKEDFSTVNRFEGHGGGWGYSGHSVEAIRFMPDTDILIGGLGLFGGRGEYFGKIKLFELGPDGGENETDGELMAESEEMPFDCAAREKFPMMFEEPVLCQANHWYVAWARVSGPSSDCGSNGQPTVTTEDQVVFKFKSSKKSNNGTDVNAGQIPQLLYRLPVHESSSSSRSTDQVEPAHILSREYSRTVSPDCFEALLKLLHWAWSAFNRLLIEAKGHKGHSLASTVLDLERLEYICTSCLRLLKIYICELYPPYGPTKRTPPESQALSEGVGNTRSCLRQILIQSRRQGISQQVLGRKEERAHCLTLYDNILKQCHQTFTACFHAFYPTGSLKWTCLCDLLDLVQPGSSDVEGYSRLLAAVLEALCQPTVRLTSMLPIMLDRVVEAHKDTNDPVGSPVGEICHYPTLVTYIMQCTEKEGQSMSHWSFREVLDKLLAILILPVRQALNQEKSSFPSILVSNTSALLAAIVSELSAGATGYEGDLQSHSRPLLTTPNRFTRTSPNLYWNPGNGVPDAVSFSVDRTGVMVAGVCVYGGMGVYEYEVELLEEQGDGNGSGLSQDGRWTSLELTKGSYGPEDCINDIAEIRFERAVPLKSGIKYAIRLKNRGSKTLNGDGGMPKVKGPDGTTFSFSACSLSSNGTNHTRGQIPQILYYSSPQDGDAPISSTRVLAECHARKKVIQVVSAIVHASTDLLTRAQCLGDEHIVETLGSAKILSTLLPLVLAYIGPVAALDPRSAVQVLGLVQEIMPPISHLISQASPRSPASPPPGLDSGVIQEEPGAQKHYAVVESEHPYKPATVNNYRVAFPDTVKWMVLEFDPQSGTAQNEDALQLYVPGHIARQCMNNSQQQAAAGGAALPGEEEEKDKWWPVLRSFSRTDSWPCLSFVLPGNEICFSLETASDYVKDDKACTYGFRCSVVGYEWTCKLEEGLMQVEKEVTYLGGMCAASLLRKDVLLPQVSGDDYDEDSDTAEEGALQVYNAHSSLLSKGFALSSPPNISQALDGNIPFSWTSNERSFLKDFVSCTAGTSGGRLAGWLQPESYVDPRQCEIIYRSEELKCSWPANITVVTKDQYGQIVHVPNLKVEAKAVPVVQDQHQQQRRSRYEESDLTYGGHPPPKLDASYQVTMREKKDAFHAISMMKAYENYSFEELRYASPPVPRPSENMLIRANNDGTYSANWTPSSAGKYNVHVTIDGYETGEVYKVDVKEPPQGMMPPNESNNKKQGPQPAKTRKFVAQWSAGLRVRLNPSLQSEQIGVIKPQGVISFVDEIHNDDGVWLRLSPDSIKSWCHNGYTEGWALQYNQHLGKTLLVPLEEPKSLLDEIIKETILRKLPELINEQEAKTRKGGPGSYQVVKCGTSGHNIRCRPSKKATATGMLTLGDTVNAVGEVTNSDGTWIQLEFDSIQRYCHELEGEAWSLAVGQDTIVYLQHESELSAEPTPFSGGFQPSTSMTEQKGFDFTSAFKSSAFTGFSTDTGTSQPGGLLFGLPPSESGSLERKGSAPTGHTTEPGPSGRRCKSETPRPGLSGASTSAADGAESKESFSREIPVELQGVSVKELIKALGESRVNGNGATPPRSPPGTPKKTSRSSSPKPIPIPSKRSSRGGSPASSVSPKQEGAKLMAAALGPSSGSRTPPRSPQPARRWSEGEGFATPPQTPPVAPKEPSPRPHSPVNSPHRSQSASPQRSPFTSPYGTLSRGSSSAQSSPYSSLSRTTGSSPFTSPASTMGRSGRSLSAHSSPSGTLNRTGSPQVSPHGTLSSRGSPRGSPQNSLSRRLSVGATPSSQGSSIKAQFSIGTSTSKDDVRLSPKSSRKERGRSLRSKKDRTQSPATKERSHRRHRSRSGSGQGSNPVKEAMAPSLAECVRAVFAAFLWHEGIVHDAMACASYLKFHPNLKKEVPPPVTSRPSSRASHSRQSSQGSHHNMNINEALKEVEKLPAKERCNSEGPGRAEEALKIKEGSTVKVESDLPPTLQHIVYFWEELSTVTHKVILQNLILPSPAVNAKKVDKGGTKERDKDDFCKPVYLRFKNNVEPADKKGKKKKEVKGPQARQGFVFGEAGAPQLIAPPGDQETLCELCGGSFPHPITYHMRATHAGCGRHAGGQGYNSGGNYCGGWAGNCGDGGIGGSTWYLLCIKCRDRYLKDKRQAIKEKSKKSRKKGSGKTLLSPQVMEAHLVMKNNALFLLDMASASGMHWPTQAPVQPPKRSTHSLRLDSSLPSVSEDSLLEGCAFPPTPFTYLLQKGAADADSAFSEEVVLDDEDRLLWGRRGDWLSRSHQHGEFQLQRPKRSDSVGTQPQPSYLLESPEQEMLDQNGDKSGAKSAGASPEVDPWTGRQVPYLRSISDISSQLPSSVDIEAGKRHGRDLPQPRKRNNSGSMAEGGLSLLKRPSAAMNKLVKSVDLSVGPLINLDLTLQRPVMAFVTQRHDLDGLQAAMKQALRKSACRVHALQALNWLVRTVTQQSCLHDLLWFFVGSLTPNTNNEVEEAELDKDGKPKPRDQEADADNAMCEHPLSDVAIAGEAVHPLPSAFHAFLQTISDVMMYLPSGSALQQMAVRCWCLKFRPSDHMFLHKSHVFSNISKILSSSDEEGEENGMPPDPSQMGTKVEHLKDLTAQVDLKASSRQAMIASLTDNSTETFWESGDEDRNKTKCLNITCRDNQHPLLVYVHIDNARDLGNKVSSIIFSAGSSQEEMKKLKQVEVGPRDAGWMGCLMPPTRCSLVRLEFKGPDNTLRIRQVKVLGAIDGVSMDVGGRRSTQMMQHKNCESETLKVFRLLTSQVFGKLLSEPATDEDRERQKEAGQEGKAEGDVDLKEHMVGILFSRSKLSHLQKQVCAHIVQAIQKETIHVQEEWETALLNKARPPEEGNKVSDAYCFELLSMVLALSGSRVGRRYLAQQYGLLQDLLTLLHTASPRVQRQVTALLRRVLPEVPPQTLANLLLVPTLPAKDFSIAQQTSQSELSESFDPEKPGILDVFLACIAKALTVQIKVKGQAGGKGISTVVLHDCLPASVKSVSRWWLRGHGSSQLAESIIAMLKDMADGNLSEAWGVLTKGAIAENILALTKLGEGLRAPSQCTSTPTLWLSLASLCVLDRDHVERLSSGQWVRGGDDHSQPRPTCDNHDDGETTAMILCDACGNLCADCDRFLHLHRRTRNHQRQVFKEEEEAIKVDLHEGCGRTKLFWLMALADAKTLKAMVEFREGTKAKLRAAGGVGTCRFCGTSDSTGMLAVGNVCADPDCQAHAKKACTKTHSCGHMCGGIRGEDPCLPCLHGCRNEGSVRLKQDGDDMCMVCFTEAISAAPAIQLTCSHVFHFHCCSRVLEKRWVGPRITFGFSLCPICKSAIDHPRLRELLEPIRTLYSDVRRKALMRLEYEGLHKAEAITTAGARFYNDPAGFAMERYAYYVCFKCGKAYYGGEARCEEQAGMGDEYDPSELVCGACSDVSRAQMCPKHGTDFLEYKCRYCCSVAVFFCFGTTHFCNACHDDFQRVTNISKSDLPHCPAGPRAVQLDGEECPLHVQHPPTGEEFALGCGVCRNAHTF